MAIGDLFDQALKIVTGRLGETCSYFRGPGPTLIEGVFDEAFERVELDSGVAVASVAPMILIRIADLPSEPRKGDRLYVRGNEYEVKFSRPDGNGAAELDLEYIGVAGLPG